MRKWETCTHPRRKYSSGGDLGRLEDGVHNPKRRDLQIKTPPRINLHRYPQRAERVGSVSRPSVGNAELNQPHHIEENINPALTPSLRAMTPLPRRDMGTLPNTGRRNSPWEIYNVEKGKEHNSTTANLASSSIYYVKDPSCEEGIPSTVNSDCHVRNPIDSNTRDPDFLDAARPKIGPSPGYGPPHDALRLPKGMKSALTGVRQIESPVDGAELIVLGSPPPAVIGNPAVEATTVRVFEDGTAPPGCRCGCSSVGLRESAGEAGERDGRTIARTQQEATRGIREGGGKSHVQTEITSAARGTPPRIRSSPLVGFESARTATNKKGGEDTTDKGCADYEGRIRPKVMRRKGRHSPLRENGEPQNLRERHPRRCKTLNQLSEGIPKPQLRRGYKGEDITGRDSIDHKGTAGLRAIKGRCGAPGGNNEPQRDLRARYPRKCKMLDQLDGIKDTLKVQPTHLSYGAGNGRKRGVGNRLNENENDGKDQKTGNEVEANRVGPVTRSRRKN